MLSFMREQGIEALKQGNDPAGKSTELPGTLGATPSEQYLTVANKNRTRKSNYLLLVLFCAGMLVLWYMIKKSTPQSVLASVGTDTQIETALAKLAGVRAEMFSNLDELAERFYKFADVRQVKNDELIKNPFKTEIVYGGFGQAVNSKNSLGGPGTETPQKVETERYTGHMQLLSIMASDEKRCCMIDDRILYEGETIKGFKVRYIGDDFVKLEQVESNDPNINKGNTRTEIVLKLSE